jgi:ribose/xylose/arabinose/galactoside ABC-type transport system permease subunit
MGRVGLIDRSYHAFQASKGGTLSMGRVGTAQILSLVVVALVIVFWLLLGDQLFSVRALQSMAFQLPELGILPLAMMVTLISGGLNLSIISTANLCALAIAWVLTTHAAGAEGVVWAGWQVIAVLAGLAVGTIVGLISGFVIAYLDVSPILVTLGTMTMSPDYIAVSHLRGTSGLCHGGLKLASHSGVVSALPFPPTLKPVAEPFRLRHLRLDGGS